MREAVGDNVFDAQGKVRGGVGGAPTGWRRRRSSPLPCQSRHTVDAGNADVLDPASGRLDKHLGPEGSAFASGRRPPTDGLVGPDSDGHVSECSMTRSAKRGRESRTRGFAGPTKILRRGSRSHHVKSLIPAKFHFQYCDLEMDDLSEFKIVYLLQTSNHFIKAISLTTIMSL